MCSYSVNAVNFSGANFTFTKRGKDYIFWNWQLSLVAKKFG